MAVSRELIEEFQKIVKEEHNKDLTFEDASSIANGLVGYFDLLAKINFRDEEAKKIK